MSKRRGKSDKYTNKKAFLSPGTLEYVGKTVTGKTSVDFLEFNEKSIQQKNITNISEIKTFSTDEKVIWVDIDGLHEIEVVEAIGKQFHLHPLLLEDVLNTEQKPKIEQFGEKHLFVVMKMLCFDDMSTGIDTEHVALILGKDYVISFQELQKTDVFAPIHERLRRSVGKTRRGKSDYLFYSLCDLIVDNYFVVLEKISEKIEELEIKIIEKPHASDQTQIYELKRELLAIRKMVQPLRDIFNAIIREESDLINESTKIYFRDVYDHALQILDSIDTNREMIDNIQNIFFTNMSNKMNSIMKTLTVFTAIFMPLSFIAGIYGMNFDNMPELRDPHGYHYALASMFIVGVGLWAYFKWKSYV